MSFLLDGFIALFYVWLHPAARSAAAKPTFDTNCQVEQARFQEAAQT